MAISRDLLIVGGNGVERGGRPHLVACIVLGDAVLVSARALKLQIFGLRDGILVVCRILSVDTVTQQGADRINAPFGPHLIQVQDSYPLSDETEQPS